MAVYLSPGVFFREVDLSVNAAITSGIIPAFVGTANKGPVGVPTLVTTAEQFISTFGEPFTDSDLGYSVLAFMQDGDKAWVLRVGIECEDGQDSELATVCIDTAGTMEGGWGRIALFSGIDYGRIDLTVPTTAVPFVFHDDSVDNIDFNDIDVSSTDGETVATLNFTGSSAYTDATDEAFIVLITAGPSPSSGSVMDGAEYEILRESDGTTVASGVIAESLTPGTSDPITVGTTGLEFEIVVTGTSPLEANDTFTFQAHPDNRHFAVSVEGVAATVYTLTAATYTDPDDFATDMNALLTTEDYQVISSGGELYFRTDTRGERIQFVEGTSTNPDTEAFALEVGIQKWTYDIPRSHVVGDEVGPFNINGQNNSVKFTIVGTSSKTITVSLPVGSSTPTESLASYVHAGGIDGGDRYFEAFALQTSNSATQLLVVTDADHELWQLTVLATASNPKSVKFVNEVGIPYPYTTSYRGFTDTRVVTPAEGAVTASSPLSCEDDPSSDDCAADTAYFENLVGFIVATSAGTWINDFTLSLELFNSTPEKYTIKIYDGSLVVERIDNISFDPDDERYISNIVNTGSTIGGKNGNAFINWIERSSNIGADEVRQPGLLNQKAFSAGANGIPADVSFSSDLDAAIIGNPVTPSGLYTLSNPEAIDISLLSIPGNSSGAVIAAAIAICEGRGDTVFIVDPPFGLKPQQVVDWHNGILNSDLTAALNTSYAALYYSWVKIFDQFSRQEIFVPPSGYIAGVVARTERVSEVWFPPAGLNRGRLPTVLDLEFSPTLGERDLLYGFNNAVNPLVKFPQDGITIWGQRTLQRTDSALDRVNVRLLLNFLKKNLLPVLRPFVFEINDRFTRARVTGVVSDFMRDIAQRRGVTDWKVVCDESNNTAERIDRHELWVAIFIKPPQAIEFVQVDLVVLRTGDSFSAREVLIAGGVVVQS